MQILGKRYHPCGTPTTALEIYASALLINDTVIPDVMKQFIKVTHCNPWQELFSYNRRHVTISCEVTDIAL